jgi:hypothetical protein
LFVTSRPDKAHANKCWGLTADSLANVMKREMLAAGVPADFLPHSARHAGIAMKKKQGWSDEAIMGCANMGQRTYVGPMSLGAGQANKWWSSWAKPVPTVGKWKPAVGGGGARGWGPTHPAYA